MEQIWAAEVNIIDIFTPAKKIPDIGTLVDAIVQNAVILAGIILLVLLILGGFSVIVGAGAGDPKKLEQGKKTLSSALVGFIIVVAAVWIIQLIEFITGIKLFKN